MLNKIQSSQFEDLALMKRLMNWAAWHLATRTLKELYIMEGFIGRKGAGLGVDYFRQS